MKNLTLAGRITKVRALGRSFGHSARFFGRRLPQNDWKGLRGLGLIREAQFVWKATFGLALMILTTTSAFAQSQAGMDQEACAALKRSDSELNQVYREVLGKHRGDTVFLERFKAAQRAWIAFRDAELKALYPSREPGFYGSSLPMCQCVESARLTADRVKQLRGWTAPAEGDVCGGSRVGH